MKNIKLILLIFVIVIGIVPTTELKAQNISVNFSVFQQELSPYGRWMNNPRFGQVWICNTAGFRPYYTDGHWEFTNYGWAWVSDHDWGWAPFHYGRWELDPYYGWMWIPGYEWGSSWVSWSSYNGYYGWAPLGHGVNINVSFGSIPYNNWTFIPSRYICERNIHQHYISHGMDHRFRNAVVINNVYEGRGREGKYMRGPDRVEAQRYTNTRIEERQINVDDRRHNKITRQDDRVNTNIGTGDKKNYDKPVLMNDDKDGDKYQRIKKDRDYKSNDIKKVEDDNIRKPQRNNDIRPVETEINKKPKWDNNNPKNNNGFPDNRQKEIRHNTQPDNFPNRRQQIERPIRQQPAFEQRKLESRDNNNGSGFNKPNDNNQKPVTQQGNNKPGN